MQTFLQKTADYLYDKYGTQISDICIVLPNRRAGLFLKTHFSDKIKKTFWAPEVMATEDFVTLLSELQPAENITLLFELFETVKKCNPDFNESFDEFSKWGLTLINDFNEIDRYLVDPAQLFGNLKNIKELEGWSLNKDENLTDFQKQYLEFWKLLYEYYKEFNNRILSKKIAHQGLSYRIVAENIAERIGKHNWKKIIFIGFNALNKAEEKIIEFLVNSDKAEILWDVDSYYSKNKNQEAGKFFRKYDDYGVFKKHENRSYVFEENLLATDNKTITLLGAAKNIAQAKAAGSIVEQIKNNGIHLKKTAIVLADENLLFPVLHALPSELNDINITMGYPLKSTPVAGFFDILFNMHINASQIANNKHTYSFYHKDLLKYFAHPYAEILIANKNYNYANIIRQLILQKNIVFASHNTIQKLTVDLESDFSNMLSLFGNWKTPADAIKMFLTLIEDLKNKIIEQQTNSENKANLELEYLFAFTKIFKRISALIIDYPDSVKDIKALYVLFNSIVKTSTLPFYGEPLTGLQIMGMLETRTLDFENVILLSCNEDILPSGKSINSFIPFELKNYFGMPTYGDKDAIFAYHFYRLIQRAKNVYLLYNTESDVLNKGEKSRYLTQLLHELPKVNTNCSISEKIISTEINSFAANSHIRIKKTNEIINSLIRKAEKGFSPSALNIYRNCSLQFYFQVIAGLQEAEEVEEQIGADTLGSIIHEAMENLYSPYINKVIVVEDINSMKKKVSELVYSLFEKRYDKQEISFGKNFLTLNMAIKFIQNFLNSEAESIKKQANQTKQLVIKYLEKELQANIVMGDLKVKLHGKADRIDSFNNTLRIIDYKTGIVKNNELHFAEWEQFSIDTNLAKSFQLLMYTWLYKKMYPDLDTNTISGIITFRELSAGLKTVKINKNELLDDSVMNDFEEQLKNILSDIFNPQMYFHQTENIDNCIFCSFKGVCNR